MCVSLLLLFVARVIFSVAFDDADDYNQYHEDFTAEFDFDFDPDAANIPPDPPAPVQAMRRQQVGRGIAGRGTGGRAAAGAGRGGVPRGGRGAPPPPAHVPMPPAAAPQADPIGALGNQFAGVGIQEDDVDVFTPLVLNGLPMVIRHLRDFHPRLGQKVVEVDVLVPALPLSDFTVVLLPGGKKFSLSLRLPGNFVDQFGTIAEEYDQADQPIATVIHEAAVHEIAAWHPDLTQVWTDPQVVVLP